jgi:hypothetical protein
LILGKHKPYSTYQNIDEVQSQGGDKVEAKAEEDSEVPKVGVASGAVTEVDLEAASKEAEAEADSKEESAGVDSEAVTGLEAASREVEPRAEGEEM